MKISVLCLFPEIVKTIVTSSIMGKAQKGGIIAIEVVDIRDYATDRHRTCDDYPYGGGPGMILKPEPLAAALDAVGAEAKRTVFPTPSGKPFNQDYAEELAREDDLVFACGRYEGIDQRIVNMYVDDEISIGDYVISSGELASMVIIDGVCRLLSGVINAQSLETESFSDGLLEYPQYTRPDLFRGHGVPPVLKNGNHGDIENWKLIERLKKTAESRPELFHSYRKKCKDKRVLHAIEELHLGDNNE